MRAPLVLRLSMLHCSCMCFYCNSDLISAPFPTFLPYPSPPLLAHLSLPPPLPPLRPLPLSATLVWPKNSFFFSMRKPVLRLRHVASCCRCCAWTPSHHRRRSLPQSTQDLLMVSTLPMALWALCWSSRMQQELGCERWRCSSSSTNISCRGPKKLRLVWKLLLQN